MEYYGAEKDKTEEKPPRPSLKGRKKAVVAVVVIAVLALAAILSFYYAGEKSLERLRDTALSIVPGNKPKFYSLLIEKNGKDYELTDRDTFEVTYRDVFVIKKVSASSPFSLWLSADIEGLGTENDLGVLLKGIDLVDKVMSAEPTVGAPAGHCFIKVRYRGEVISKIPVNVVITPQDWVRQAKETQGGQSQVDYLKKAEEMNGADPDVNRMLARAYLQEGQKDKAIDEYRKILKRRPDDVQAMAELARLLMEQKRYSEAADLYRKVTRANPKDAAAYANMGYAYGELENWEAAGSAYAESLKINPHDATVRFRMAEACEKAGKPAQAVEHYRLALEKNGGMFLS